MILLKKIAGYFLIVIAIVLAMSTLKSGYDTITQTSKKIDKSGISQGIAYMLGSLVVIVLFILLTIYLLKKGVRLVKSKPKVEDSIEDIGNEI